MYVGKAKNLKKRVRNYAQLKRLVPRIHQMVHVATKLQWQILESEVEALLIEAELIRTHQPEYNVLLKDDKTALYIHITADVLPRLFLVRKKELLLSHPKGSIIGPFQSTYKLKQVLALIRPIFKWCNHPLPLDIGASKARPCFYYHIDLCSGACIGEIAVEDYQRDMKHLTLFLKGKTQTVVKQIQQEMEQKVAQEKFEEAASLRDQIEIIKDVTSPTKKLAPDMILPQLKEQISQEQVLHLQRILSEYLALPKKYPLHRIEGYDVSNIQGTNAAVSMVTFTDGKPDKSEYKVFNIKTLNTPNDYGMMKEALQRRQNHPEWGMPDLIVIDGGRGQLRAALSIWEWTNPVISIVKHPDRLVIPQSETLRTLNETKNHYYILKLPENHPALRLVQQVRDESHRFSKKQHTRLRTRNMIGSTV